MRPSSLARRGVFFFAALMTLSLLLLACGKERPASREEEKAAVQHAPSGVQPGSYEDWCEEHQVPESQCTRCNPTLVAAFQATGDWCAEHGLPESQCLACNPDLKIVRPPKTEEK